MLALSRVSVFIASFSVKVGKTVCVSREVSRNPVENDADSVFMAGVDEIHQVMGRAVS